MLLTLMDAATVLSTELTFDLSSSSFQFCQEEATWSWHKNHDPFVKDQWFISTGPFVKDHQAKVLNKSLALSAANATIFDIFSTGLLGSLVDLTPKAAAVPKLRDLTNKVFCSEIVMSSEVQMPCFFEQVPGTVELVNDVKELWWPLAFHGPLASPLLLSRNGKQPFGQGKQNLNQKMAADETAL